MKKLLFFAVLFLTIPVAGQNEYRVGDKFTQQAIQFISFEKLEGKNLVWDFSKQKETFADCPLRYFSNRDSTILADMASFDQYTKFLYRQTKDTSSIVGFQNKQVRVKYEQPEIDLCHPLNYGDSMFGYFSAKGDDVLGHFIRIFGRYKYEVSGMGTLITMDGDTLSQTLLVHNTRWISTQYGNKENMLLQYGTLDSVPCLELKELKEQILKDTTLIKDDIYRWYSSGFRYPILRQEMLSTPKGENLYASALYIPIDLQEQLEDDTINEKIRMEERLKKDVLAKQLKYETPLLGGCYEISISSSCTSLKLAYTLNQDAKVMYGIYTQDGMVLYIGNLEYQKQGNHKEDIGLSGTNMSNKVFTLFVNGIPFSKVIH